MNRQIPDLLSETNNLLALFLAKVLNDRLLRLLYVITLVLVVILFVSALNLRKIDTEIEQIYKKLHMLTLRSFVPKTWDLLGESQDFA